MPFPDRLHTTAPDRWDGALGGEEGDQSLRRFEFVRSRHDGGREYLMELNLLRKDPGEGTSKIDDEMRMDAIPSQRPYVEVLDFARRDQRVIELEA